MTIIININIISNKLYAKYHLDTLLNNEKNKIVIIPYNTFIIEFMLFIIL